MKKILPFLLGSLALLAACGAPKEANKPGADKAMTEINLVLDYVPNTNHSGIYLAAKKGYYAAANLKVTIIEPGDDATSISLVGAGKGELGVSYQENVTFAKADGSKIPVTAIATILKHNTSGFVTRKDSGIRSPKEFENKVYAGWQSPSEEAVLHAVMNQAKADFSKLTMVGSPGTGPQGLGKDFDIQWYFEGWDLVKAAQAGIDVNYMPLRELDPRLDYYTPVIIGNDSYLKKNPEIVKAFLAATKKGYQDAIKEPKETAAVMHEVAPEYELSFLEASQDFLSKNYTDEPEKWGVMEQKVWDNYTDFMVEEKLIKEKVPSESLFTNDFLE